MKDASDGCRVNVEALYYTYSGRSAYDIRHASADPTPDVILHYIFLIVVNVIRIVFGF